MRVDPSNGKKESWKDEKVQTFFVSSSIDVWNPFSLSDAPDWLKEKPCDSTQFINLSLHLTFWVYSQQKVKLKLKTLLVDLQLILRKCQWIQSGTTYVWTKNRFHRVCYLRKEDHPHISKLRYYWLTLPQPPNWERAHRGAAFEIQQTLHINSDVKAGSQRGWGGREKGGIRKSQ